MTLPEKIKGDWDDIPRAGINYKTSKNMKMNVLRQKKAVGGYYASVAYIDAQIGKVCTNFGGESEIRNGGRFLVGSNRRRNRRCVAVSLVKDLAIAAAIGVSLFVLGTVFSSLAAMIGGMTAS